MDELTRRRMEHNEEVFKAVNEEIEGRAAGSPVLECVCECSDTSCSELIRLTHDAYAHVRSGEDWYIVLPGHELLEVEHVVERRDGYVVVQKP